MLALNVSVDNMASFLGIEPQSLSRIRKQVIFQQMLFLCFI